MMHVLGVELNENEERIAVIRSSVRLYVPRILFGVVWVLSPFYLLFPLLRLGKFGVVFAVLLGVSGVAYLVSIRATWYGTALLLTNQRCVDVVRRGLGPPSVTFVPWSAVAGVRALHGGFLKKLWGLSTLRVDLDASKPFAFELAGVRHVERVRDLVHEVQLGRKDARG